MNEANCGVCNRVVPMDRKQIGRWEIDGSMTPYHMYCEGRAKRVKPCEDCGHHRLLCNDCGEVEEVEHG